MIFQIVLVGRLELAVRTPELVRGVDELHVLLQTVHRLATFGADLTEPVVVFVICDAVYCPLMVSQINGRPELV